MNTRQRVCRLGTMATIFSCIIVWFLFKQVYTNPRSIHHIRQFYFDERRYSCSNQSHHGRIEDILCMKPPSFLENYRNPCWMLNVTNGASKLQCLPYFQIIGCSKSGTTDLYHRITQHPSIVHATKENYYWSWRRYGKCEFNMTFCTSLLTFKNYLKFFNVYKIQSSRKVRNGIKDFHNLVTGYADPIDIWGMYYWKDIPQNNVTWMEPKYTTPHLIHHVNPSVKLILILREPAERMYSHYIFRKLGKSATEFHKHAVGNVTLLTKCEKHTGSMRACLFNSTLLKRFRKFPVHGSFYSILLKEWLSVFPRNQFFIMRTEDYARNISFYLQQIFNFLSLDNISKEMMNKISQHYVIRKTASKAKIGKMLPETKEFLNEIFQPYTKELSRILQDDRYLWNDIK